MQPDWTFIAQVQAEGIARIRWGCENAGHSRYWPPAPELHPGHNGKPGKVLAARMCARCGYAFGPNWRTEKYCASCRNLPRCVDCRALLPKHYRGCFRLKLVARA